MVMMRCQLTTELSNISRLDEDSSSTETFFFFGCRNTAQKHKTSLGIPRWPADE